MFRRISHHQMYRLLWSRTLLLCCNVVQLFLFLKVSDYSRCCGLSRCCHACVSFFCNMWLVILELYLKVHIYVCPVSAYLMLLMISSVCWFFYWFSEWLSWMFLFHFYINIITNCGMFLNKRQSNVLLQHFRKSAA
jgi:hypothetical protein